MKTEDSIEKNINYTLSKRLEECIQKAEDRKNALRKITKSINKNNQSENNKCLTKNN